MCQPKYLDATEPLTETPKKRKAPGGGSIGGGSRARTLTLDELQENFHLPINEVACKLGVCVTVLKQQCRELGIVRWPYRKVRKLDNMLSALENAGPEKARPFALTNGEEERQRKISSVKKTLLELLSNPNSCAHLKLGKVKAAAAARLPGTPAFMQAQADADATEGVEADEAVTSTPRPRTNLVQQAGSSSRFETLHNGPQAGDELGAAEKCLVLERVSGSFLHMMERSSSFVDNNENVSSSEQRGSSSLRGSGNSRLEHVFEGWPEACLQLSLNSRLEIEGGVGVGPSEALEEDDEDDSIHGRRSLMVELDLISGLEARVGAEGATAPNRSKAAPSELSAAAVAACPSPQCRPDATSSLEEESCAKAATRQCDAAHSAPANAAQSSIATSTLSTPPATHGGGSSSLWPRAAGPVVLEGSVSTPSGLHAAVNHMASGSTAATAAAVLQAHNQQHQQAQVIRARQQVLASLTPAEVLHLRGQQLVGLDRERQRQQAQMYALLAAAGPAASFVSPAFGAVQQGLCFPGAALVSAGSVGGAFPLMGHEALVKSSPLLGLGIQEALLLGAQHGWQASITRPCVDAALFCNPLTRAGLFLPSQ